MFHQLSASLLPPQTVTASQHSTLGILVRNTYMKAVLLVCSAQYPIYTKNRRDIKNWKEFKYHFKRVVVWSIRACSGLSINVRGGSLSHIWQLDFWFLWLAPCPKSDLKREVSKDKLSSLSFVQVCYYAAFPLLASRVFLMSTLYGLTVSVRTRARGVLELFGKADYGVCFCCPMTTQTCSDNPVNVSSR